VTDPDAPAAKNAEAVVPVDKRVIPPDLPLPPVGREMDSFNPDGFNDLLKLATAIDRAQDTSRDLSGLPYRRLVVIAGRFFGADQAGMRVFGQNELEDAPPERYELGRRRTKVQPLLDGCAAGRDIASAPFDFDEA
jgi:hypothetical protein